MENEKMKIDFSGIQNEIKSIRGKGSRKRLSNKLTEILEELKDTIVTDPELMAQFAKKMSGGFRRYSFNNTILIWVQRPDFTMLAGYKQWINEHNRAVMRGEKAIRIIAPRYFKKDVEKDDGTVKEEKIQYFVTVSIFDIKQTGKIRNIYTPGIPGGKTIRVLDPQKIWYPEHGNSDFIKGELDYKLIEQISDVKMVEDEDIYPCLGLTNFKWVKVYPLSNKTAQAGNAVHELAHIRLEHDKKVNGKHLSKTVQETEADAVKYTVLTYFGVEDIDAKYYIGNWGGTSGILKERAKRILDVSETIINDIEAIKVMEDIE